MAQNFSSLVQEKESVTLNLVFVRQKCEKTRYIVSITSQIITSRTQQRHYSASDTQPLICALVHLNYADMWIITVQEINSEEVKNIYLLALFSLKLMQPELFYLKHLASIYHASATVHSF